MGGTAPCLKIADSEGHKGKVFKQTSGIRKRKVDEGVDGQLLHSGSAIAIDNVGERREYRGVKQTFTYRV